MNELRILISLTAALLAAIWLYTRHDGPGHSQPPRSHFQDPRFLPPALR